MEKKKISYWVPILWLITTGCWLFVLGADFCCQSTPEWLVLLHVLTALVSLLAAITNYIRYKNQSKSN